MAGEDQNANGRRRPARRRRRADRPLLRARSRARAASRSSSSTPARAERASEVAAGMIAPVGEASWGEEALLAAALDSAERWPGVRRATRGRRAASRSATGAAAPLHVGLDRDEAAELRRIHDLHGELGLESEWLTAGACRRARAGARAPTSPAGSRHPARPRSIRAVVLAALRAACATRRRRGRARARSRASAIDGAGRRRAASSGRRRRGSRRQRVLLAAGARIGELAARRGRGRRSGR